MPAHAPDTPEHPCDPVAGKPSDLPPGGDLAAYYAARAAEYDRVYLKPERQDDLRQIEDWLPGRFDGKHVLELACGTGWWTRLIAPRAASVLAVDAAQQTLRIARARLAAEEGSAAWRVEFVLGDAYALPDNGERFDAAFAGFWWSHVPLSRLRPFLLGLHARLRPGARVVFLDNRFVPGSSTPLADTDAEGNTWQLRRLGDGSMHRVLKNFPSEAQLLEAVQGLAREVRVRRWAYYWAMEYAALPVAA